MGPQQTPGHAFPWKGEIGPFDVERVYFAVPYSDSDADIKDLQRLPNVIAISAGSFCCDDRTKLLLDNLSLPTSEWRHVPVTVFNRAGKTRDDFWYFRSNTIFEPVDRSKSEFTVYEVRPDIIKNVTKWSFLVDRLPPCDLFYSEGGKLIATETLRIAFGVNKITGCRFKFACYIAGK